MTDVRFADRERGAGASGYLVALGVLVVVGLVAWWMLAAGGFLGSDPSDSSPTDTEDAGPGQAGVDQPYWLEGTGQILTPPLAIDEREPASHLMAPWVWDFVDDTWDVTIVRAGTGDGGLYLNDMQTMFLVAPDGLLFRLHGDLRNDYNLDVLAWDPETLQAWLVRGGKAGMEPVVQFDLRTGDTQESWSGNAVPGANSVGLGVGNVYPLDTQANGSELWVAQDESGLVTGVFWRRPDGAFQRSVVTDEIRRLRLQGFSEDQGVDAWIGVDNATAVYRGTFRIDGRIDDEVWILHDLDSDDFERVNPRLPSGADCSPLSTVRGGGQFDGERIVALCRSSGTGSTVLIDPTGEQDPQ